MGKHENGEISEVMPLSFVITIPVIYDALGTHMNATTCAIWTRYAKRWNGICPSNN